jgi:hypothetical protein
MGFEVAAFFLKTMGWPHDGWKIEVGVKEAEMIGLGDQELE